MKIATFFNLFNFLMMASQQKANESELKSFLNKIVMMYFMFGLIFLSMGTFKKFRDEIGCVVCCVDGCVDARERNTSICTNICEQKWKRENFSENVHEHTQYESIVLPRKYLTSLPDHFDARDHWPKCADIIGHISNQGECESCWAVAIADVGSDRECIASDGYNRTRLSARDMMDVDENAGCKGGNMISALKNFIKYGIVTEQCKPYPSLVSVKFSYQLNTIYKQLFPPSYDWEDFCSNSQVDYMSNLYYGKSFRILPNDEHEIREEIYRNGPVLATMVLRTNEISNMNHWKNAQVYSCQSMGEDYHAVRIIGWGVEEHGGKLLPYWLVANSWGRQWGKWGTFKVARGNHLSCIQVYAVYM